MDDDRPVPVESQDRDNATFAAAIHAALAAHQVSYDDPAFLVMQALDYTVRCTEEIPARIEAAAKAQVAAVEASATAATTKAALLANNVGTALVAEIKQIATIHQAASKSIVTVITDAAVQAAEKVGEQIGNDAYESYKSAHYHLKLEAGAQLFLGGATVGFIIVFASATGYFFGQQSAGPASQTQSMITHIFDTPAWIPSIPLALSAVAFVSRHVLFNKA